MENTLRLPSGTAHACMLAKVLYMSRLCMPGHVLSLWCASLSVLLLKETHKKFISSGTSAEASTASSQCHGMTRGVTAMTILLHRADDESAGS
jgi:hypothetical protein